MTWIIIIAIVVAVIYCIVQLLRSKRISNNTVICFTGGLGSGKTFHAVKYAVRAYKSARWRYRFSKIPVLGWILLKFNKATKNKPVMYSNIPVVIKYRGKHPEFSRPLLKEHLLMTKPIEEGAIVLIDEVGQFASQYDHDNPYVMENVQTLIRFFRHFINGRLFLTDQCSDNIVVPIRRRVNIIYNLNDFHRVLFLPIYKCSVKELTVTEDVKNIKDVAEREEEYFCGLLHYFNRKPRYDSRCYSELYMNEPDKYPPEAWEKFKTKYLIDIEATEEQRKHYKKYRSMQ